MAGVETDTISEKKFNNALDAKGFFAIAKQRLLNVNNWNEYAGKLSSGFQVCNRNGDEVQRNVEEGDYLKINITAPGPESGDGFDWVKVERVIEEVHTQEELISIKVRPASNPSNKNNDIAHFFDDQATSTFIIKRNKARVIAEVHGRNEIANTNADALTDKVRNSIVATIAFSGFSKLQWKLLTEGLLKDI